MLTKFVCLIRQTLCVNKDSVKVKKVKKNRLADALMTVLSSRQSTVKGTDTRPALLCPFAGETYLPLLCA